MGGKRKRKQITYYAKKAIRNDNDILICAGDVETDGLGGDLLMIQWSFLGQFKYATSPEMVDEFFNDLLSMPYPAVWFFHFGQYDWRYFLDYISENDLIVEVGMRTETDIYEIRVKRCDDDEWSIMRDSYALWPHDLKSLADSFCPELPKLEIDIENFNPHNPEHIEYAKRDVEILINGLPRLFDMLNKYFGVNPSATTAGTALRAWQFSLPDNIIYDTQKWGADEAFIRMGYYGGLVFLTSDIAHENCVTYDINSSYPASMEEYGVPCGRPIYTRTFQTDYPGLYRVRVRTPDNLIIPILPARNERGFMRWYRGEFETVVTTQELQFAAQHGYEILELFEGYFFESIEYPFSDFISHCRTIRQRYKGKTPEQIAKLMQNSLYGRFASRRERTRLLHINSIDDDDLLGAVPFDDSGNWYVKKQLDDEMPCLPQWAAFITANSRLRLLRAAYDIGPENVIYGDTDSITIKSGHEGNLDIGSGYGQWSLDKEWEIFRAIAPKVYSGILVTGEYVGAAKGLPRNGITERQWRELLDDGRTSAKTMSLDSLRVAIKNGVRPAHELIRESSSLNNSMNFERLQNGQVRVKLAS